MSLKTRTVVGRWAGALALLCWICFIELYIYMDYTRPHKLDVMAGRVYALNNHGSISYLTRYEHTLLFGIAWVAGTMVAVAVIVRNASK